MSSADYRTVVAEAIRAHAGPKACGGGALEAFLERMGKGETV